MTCKEVGELSGGDRKRLNFALHSGGDRIFYRVVIAGEFKAMGPMDLGRPVKPIAW